MSTHYQCDKCGHRYGYESQPTHDDTSEHRPGCMGSVRSIEVVDGDHGWAVISPYGAVVATTEPGEPRAWAESYLARLTAGGVAGYSIVPRNGMDL